MAEASMAKRKIPPRAKPRKFNPQVRVAPSLLERAQVLIDAEFDGLTSRGKFADAAFAHFLAVKEAQFQRLKEFQAWEAGGRKGPPPALRQE